MNKIDRPQLGSPRGARLRVLVAIASFGTKNREYLEQLCRQYQAMTLSVDVVVVSEAPKQVPAGVRVVAGLPSRNPWSLPFAHMAIFAEQMDRYDLFIYSEDDIDITEAHIEAFLRATKWLEDDEIAGFLRYEKDPRGCLWMPDAHGVYRWKPESVVSRGGQLFAEFTNEHAGCYIVTRAQLKRAIASGNFLRPPHVGRYDMLVTAATDVYAPSGFRKLVCISHLAPFLVHHMSDRYAGRMGVPLSHFEGHVQALKEIGNRVRPATTLCNVESNLPETEWSKDFYEPSREPLLGMIPPEAKTVLSVGCGWAAVEAALSQRGAEVTALPLDSVVGVTAARLGVKPVYGRLEECLRALDGQKYDCVLVSNLLHLQSDPEELFNRCLALVADGGSVVVESPNFHRLTIAAKRLLNIGGCRSLNAFRKGGISVFGPRALVRRARRAGFNGADVRWYDHSLPKKMGPRDLPLEMGRLTARSWVLRATRGAGR